MSKRGLYQLLATIVLGLTYLIAAGASDNIGSRSYCVGFTSFPHWFDEGCSAALVPRLFIIGLGVIPVVLLWYFAGKADVGTSEKPSPPVTNGRRAATSAEAHVFAFRGGEFVCMAPRCRFVAATMGEFRSHDRAMRARAGSQEPLKAAIANHRPKPPGPDVPPTPSATSPGPTVPELKTCPDCAEEVRFAARKCRFCGYQFDSAGV